MSKEILNFKALNGQVGVDEALGIVECFVAVIGNKDSVGDVIIPGAFNRSLKRRKPRVVWGHDWNQPIGKVLDIFEVPPSDPRLPMKVKSLGLGAVYARVQFNLKSERGREAFASVTFFGEEQEWSIGYKTLDAIFDPKMQANILKELELYEVSPVLHGANQLTSTLSIKSAVANLMTDKKDAEDNGFSTDPFKKAIALSLATQDASSVRVKGYDSDSVVYEVLDADGTKTYSTSYSFDGEEFLFGNAVLIKTDISVKYDSDDMDADKPVLDAEESDLRAALLSIVSTHGRFNEDKDGVWAGYTPADENRVASIGVKCSNCVFFNRNGSCDIIDMDIEPGGKCRFAVIPKGVVDVGSVDENVQDSQGGNSDGPCWPGYVQIGMKKGKNGEMVPNCVPAKDNSVKELIEEIKAGNSPGNSRLENLASLVPGADASPGKRGGDLSDLLRYWRKIMVQEGGFRRCRVILADHPELYPLNNICAWLHHETTGLWPNEGCHHPGMKNCRRKLKGKPSKPSLWSESEFANRITRNIPGKSLDMEDFKENTSWDDRVGSTYEMAKMWSEDQNLPEEESEEVDYKMFAEMLKGYFAANPDVADEIKDDDNWMHEGQGMNDDWSQHSWLIPGVRNPDEGCGCNHEKSDEVTVNDEQDSISVKAGRVLSGKNIAKLQMAYEALGEVINGGSPQQSVQVKVDEIDEATVAAMKIKAIEEKEKNRIAAEERVAKWATEGKSLDIGIHAEWLAPVVAYHEVGYSVKGNMVSYDVSDLGEEAFNVFFSAFKTAQENGR